MTSATQASTSIAVDKEHCATSLQEIIRIRSVVGEDTTAHRWLTDRLEAAGMVVDSFPVEGRRTPLLLGVLEGDGSKPGVMFDAHYDTVAAHAPDWKHGPWDGDREGDEIYGRGAVDSKGSLIAMLAAVEALSSSGQSLQGPIYFMSDSDGEDGFRGPTLLQDLDVVSRIGTIFSAEATRNSSIEIAYPGISTWKITAIGRTAHPTEPEKGSNAISKMAALVQAIDAGRLALPEGDSQWFKPRVTTNAVRTRSGGGWAIPARCDAVLSVMTPIGVSFSEVRDAIAAFLEILEKEDGDVRFEFKVLPMGAGRLWLRPGEADSKSAGVAALKEAVSEVSGNDAVVKQFNGGWVDAAELMRPDSSGFGTPAALTFGPGDFSLAHTVDEHISAADVAEAAEIYARATLSLLG